MKQEKMVKYMNLLDDKYILEAAPKGVIPVQKKKSGRLLSKAFLRYGSFVASLIFVIGIGVLISHLHTGSPALPSHTDEFPPETLTRPDTHVTPDTQRGEDTNVPIGGEHMGDELYSPYIGYVDGVIYKKGTFSENYAQYMGKFDEMEGEWKNDRPAVMYYLAQEMDLTREDLEVYYAAVGYENVPEYVYEGLLADSLEESMQLLKSDYAFYNDGKLYTVYDIYALNRVQSEIPDGICDEVTAEEYEQVWRNIDTYLDSVSEGEISEDIVQYVDSKIQNEK